MNSIDTKINTLSTSISKGEIVLYQPNESVRLEVRLENDTVWLTQAQMAELFSVKVPAVSKHIKNIYEEGELESLSTVSKKEIVRKEGRTSVKEQAHFMEIALGSLNEVMCQLELANELGYINENQLFEAEEQVKAVAQMLAGLRNSKRRPS